MAAALTRSPSVFRSVRSNGCRDTVADRVRDRARLPRGVAAGIDARDARLLCLIRPDMGAERSFREGAAKCGGQVRGHARARSDEQALEGYRPATVQNDGRPFPLHGQDPFSFNLHATRSEHRLLCGVGFEGVIQEKCGRSPIRQHHGLVQAVLARRQKAYAPQPELIAVAIRAMEDGAAPAFLKAGYRGQFVHHSRGQNQTARRDLFVPQRDHEMGSLPRRGLGRSLDKSHIGIGEQLQPTAVGDSRGRLSVTGEKSVRGSRKTVPREPGIDHNDRAPRSRQ